MVSTVFPFYEGTNKSSKLQKQYTPFRYRLAAYPPLLPIVVVVIAFVVQVLGFGFGFCRLLF